MQTKKYKIRRRPFPRNQLFILGMLFIIIIIGYVVVGINILEKNALYLPKIDPMNAYWLYSSIMQLNGAIIGLFFISLSIAISREKNFVDSFGILTSFFLYINTGILTINTFICCLGIFYPDYFILQKIVLLIETFSLILLFSIIISIANQFLALDYKETKKIK